MNITNNLSESAESQVEAQPVEGSQEQPDAVETGTSNEEESTQPDVDVQAQDGQGFTDKIDPSKLSPELQKVYKSMQSDYTKKTQEISMLKEDYQTAKQAQQFLAQLGQEKEFQTWYDNFYKMKQSGGKAVEKEAEPDFDTMTDDEKYEYIAKKVSKDTEERLRNEFNQTYGTFMNNEIQQKARATIDTFKQGHPETNDMELSRLAPIIKRHGLTLDQAYAMTYPDRVGKAAVDKARQELYVKKQANLETGNLPGEATPTSSSKPSFREALEMAKREAK